MRLPGNPQAHASYCTNVHAGESLAEVTRALSEQTSRVKAVCAPEGAFGVGLRLSAAAARELREPEAYETFAATLAAHDFYVFTLNGFPYGAFHDTRVKERVYEPDWSDPRRLAYTLDLAHTLERLLPNEVTGSISTVPGAFKPAATEQSTQERIASQLLRAVAELARLEARSGKTLVLALEPEPHCMLETTDETLGFFTEHLLDERALTELGRELGVNRASAEVVVRRHLGVCLDACHAAVEFESPLECHQRYAAAGIQVAKIQISAGLKLDPRAPEALAELRAFDEGVYLHQVVERNRGELRRFLDLPQAFERVRHAAPGRAPGETWGADAEWRVHFHVPVFSADAGAFSTTQPELLPLLRYLGGLAEPLHVEVETYTWDVLPTPLRSASLPEALARELTWTCEALSTTEREGFQ